ncbi:MAG TPA: DUF5076 domain-containing protein [Allosphingosinicella sp.]|nr:DUF5076 domain-containing protein [Allosphingosinicella sp.]
MNEGHPNAIALEDGDILTEDSHEVMRVWVTNGAGSSVWINAGALEDPHVFGFLIADTVRHAALAYASAHDLDEDAALQAIVDGLGEELREQFNEITAIQKGSLD